jgi:uncharacterized ion transporter superfamily protein YfcC
MNQATSCPPASESPVAPGKRFPIPHTYVIIGFLMVAAALATHVVPGGSYRRIERTILVGSQEQKKMVVDPDSFAPIPAEPQNPWMMTKAVMKGLRHSSAMDIVFFILLIGGAFAVINETRAIDAALGFLVTRLENRDRLVIPVVMTAFSLGGATFGMSEETIPFVAMAVPLALKLGYDSLTGIAMVFVAAGVGFATAFLNPFTVGIAQGIAELKPFSGMSYRILLWVLFTGLTILWVMRHAARVKNDPRESPVFDLDEEKRRKAGASAETPAFTPGRRCVILFLGMGLGMIVYGATRLDWYLDEMVAVFLIVGILSGLINRLPLNRIAESFGKGCSEIANAAITVGLARAVLVILDDGKILDTFLHHVSKVVGSFHPLVSVQLMFAFQALMNFFVPSGSGQAALTMPIMTPLADLSGITRQTAVLAFQFGDGFNNLIIPTSAVTLAALGVGGVPYDRWARWILPLMVLYFLFGALCLIPPVLVGWTG